MGTFYKKKVSNYLANVYSRYAYSLQSDGRVIDKKEVIGSAELKPAAHKYCAESIDELLVEMLRYQGWIAAPFEK